ncbi:cysteine desulfurase [Methylophilaceae bacterium]|nr:cysteine desulfurase [Methylophilaceae bacterium]
MSVHYLDNNATTRVLPQVMEAMQPWFCEHYGNPASSHPLGQHARQALIAARACVAAFLQAGPAEIVFTSGATESNHMAILGALQANPSRRKIVTSAVEHSSTLRLLAQLAAQGVEVVKVPVNHLGGLDMPALAAAVTPDTALLTLMHANNETGVIFPVAEAAAIAHAHAVPLHIDAAQSAGKIPLSVGQFGCNFLSFSGHKLHAPKGVGVLYVRKGAALQPLLYGHQERNRRGGTENLPGIIGLAAACRLAQEHMNAHDAGLAGLRDRLQSGILSSLPFARVNGSEPRVPNTTNICLPGLHGEEFLHRLGQAGIMASQGSACTAGGTEPSHVLLAMGLSREDALSSVRFSLSHETTLTDVDAVTGAVAAISRQMMPGLLVA